VGRTGAACKDGADRTEKRQGNMRAELIQINDYQLTVDVDEFNEAAAALVERVERDGLDGLTRYGFYVNQATGAAGGVIAFRNAKTWADHHEMVAGWDEYQRFSNAVSLTKLEFVGDLPAELASGIEQAGIAYSHLGTLASGFVR
jgi:hypothetical protein